MFSSLVTRLIPSRTTGRLSRESMAFHARKAARAAQDADASHAPDGLPSLLGTTDTRDTRSAYDAHASLTEYARRQGDKARTQAARGHALYKATARALVNGSDSE